MARDGWQAAPSEALWCGEVVVGREVDGGTETDYFYGYSADEDEPDAADLVPVGWDLLEVKVRATPRHPAWVPPEQV